MQDYHASCLPFLVSAPTHSSLPNSTPSDCRSSHTSTLSFRYGTSFLCGTELSVRNALVLYEASTLKAEWADIRISGQFALDGNIYIFLGEKSISYKGPDDNGSFYISYTYV